MAEKEIYPKGTVQRTEEFENRQKIKKIASDVVEEVAKQTTEKAFDKLGYKKVGKKEDDINYDHGVYGTEERYGYGTANGEFNVTISKPKGVTAASSFQKVTTFGGKKLVSEIYIEINKDNLNISYKNTEASGFNQQSDGPTYAKGLLNKKINFANIDNKNKFKKELTKMFQDIADAEAKYLVNTKIGNDDKIEKDMNDSIVKEQTIKLSLKELVIDSLEDSVKKIEKLTESCGEKHEKEEACKKVEPEKEEDLLLGDKKESKEEQEEEKELEEITTSGPVIAGSEGGFKDGAQSGAGGYMAPLSGKKDDEEKIIKRNFKESYEKTPYAQAQKPRAFVKRTLEEGGCASYCVKVPVEKGSGHLVPSFKKNHTFGAPGMSLDSQPNSPGEASYSAVRDPFGVPKKSKEKADKLKEEIDEEATVEETSVDETLQKETLMKRKFVVNEENEKLGINKRYIITEKRSEEEMNERWKKLSNLKPYETIREAENIVQNKEETKKEQLNELGFVGEKNNNLVTREQGEEENARNFAKQAQVEAGDVIDGEEIIDIGKNNISGVIFRVCKKDYLNEGKAYIFDYLTQELVPNPNFKVEKY